MVCGLFQDYAVGLVACGEQTDSPPTDGTYCVEDVLAESPIGSAVNWFQEKSISSESVPMLLTGFGWL